VRDIVGAKGGTASGAPTTSCPDGPSSLPCGGKMPDQVGHDDGAGNDEEMPDQVGHDDGAGNDGKVKPGMRCSALSVPEGGQGRLGCRGGRGWFGLCRRRGSSCQ